MNEQEIHDHADDNRHEGANPPEIQALIAASDLLKEQAAREAIYRGLARRLYKSLNAVMEVGSHLMSDHDYATAKLIQQDWEALEQIK